MKNIFLIIALMLGLNSIANETITIAGQQGRVNTLKTILSHGLHVQGKTANFETIYNNGYMANGSYTSITVNGTKRYVQLSSKMMVKLSKEMNKANSNTSFRDIMNTLCTAQGNVVVNTIDDVPVKKTGYNCGHTNCGPRKCTVDLTETNSRLASLEGDHEDLNGNLIIINGKIDNLGNGQQQLAANQQIIVDNQKRIIKQNNRNLWVGIVGDVLGSVVTVVDGHNTRKAIKGINKSTIYNTTNIFHVRPTRPPGPGHNGNGVVNNLPAGFLSGYSSVFN